MEGRPDIRTDGYVWNKTWAEARISELHLALEAPGTDTEATNLLRGQIQNVRRLMEDARRAAGMLHG
jgi:hypothetical protein